MVSCQKRPLQMPFALRMLMEKYRECQKELHCVLVDLEKASDRVLRKELCSCLRKFRVSEKYVRLCMRAP